MELIPWGPFGEGLGEFHTEMDKLRNRFMSGLPFSRCFIEEWSPLMDILETKDELIVKVELPGLEAKDVNVSVSSDMLTVKGEKEKEEEKDAQYHCVERHYGSFHRSFRLPSSVKGDKVEATFDKGVLKITLPKVEEARKKEIKVRTK